MTIAMFEDSTTIKFGVVSTNGKAQYQWYTHKWT
jgi:hypothetical protein